MKRCKFNSCNRQTGETIAAYVAALRQLIEFCNFGAWLDDMLSDRLVCGINDDVRIQHRLLAETKFIFLKTLEVAELIETIEKNTEAEVLQKSQVQSQFPVNFFPERHVITTHFQTNKSYNSTAKSKSI